MCCSMNAGSTTCSCVDSLPTSISARHAMSVLPNAANQKATSLSPITGALTRIHPSFYDKLGVSLVLANSANGLEALSQCSLTMEKSSYNQAVTANPALVRNARRPEQADIFMRSFQEKGIQCLPTILSRMKPSLLIRIIRKARRMFARKPITYHRVANMLGRRPIATHIRAYRISRISLLQGLHGKRYIEKHKAETQNPY